MNQTLYESATQRRFSFGRARAALSLALLTAGLGLWALTADSDAPVVNAQQVGDRKARDSRLGNQAGSPSESLEEILSHRDIIPTHHYPLLGRPAPDFELADPDGKIWNLKELSDGRPTVLIFYYGYHCVSCVRHLSEMNRDLPLFRDIGARVVAIRADPPELTRERFQQSGPFGFPVLSDPENKVAHAYQVFKQDNLRHATAIIDREGTVQWVNVGDAPFRRNSALLCQLARMAGWSGSVGGSLP